MTKAPTPAEMSIGQSDNATKKFDNTAVADRLGTIRELKSSMIHLRINGTFNIELSILIPGLCDYPLIEIKSSLSLIQP